MPRPIAAFMLRSAFISPRQVLLEMRGADPPGVRPGDNARGGSAGALEPRTGPATWFHSTHKEAPFPLDIGGFYYI